VEGKPHHGDVGHLTNIRKGTAMSWMHGCLFLGEAGQDAMFIISSFFGGVCEPATSCAYAWPFFSFVS
jgi:hypothetical protein